jgi:hypothetical protein
MYVNLILPVNVTHNVLDNTNSMNLELYSMMAEYDNAGFPLSYCYLSTAESVELGKRKKALKVWMVEVRE